MSFVVVLQSYNYPMKITRQLLIPFILFCQFSFGQTFTESGNLNTVRTNHHSYTLYDGRVLVIGGDNDLLYSNYKIYRTCEVYDPQTGTWTYVSSMKKARSHFASAMLHDGRIIVTGGNDADNYHIADCEIYDPKTDSWELVPSLFEERRDHHAVTLHNGKVLVVGGNDDYAELYDPVTNTWRSTGQMIVKGDDGESLDLLPDGRVLYVGSRHWDKKNIKVYHSDTETWEILENEFTYDKHDHISLVLSDGRVMYIGSSSPSASTRAEIFNPLTNEIVEASPLSLGRSAGCAVELDNGKVLVYSIGNLFTTGDNELIEIYDLESDTWESISSTSPGFYNSTLNKLNDGRVLITGGSIVELATSQSFLFETGGLSNCVYVDPQIKFDETNSCYGQELNLDLQNSEAGTQYYALINGTKTAQVTGGASNSIVISSGDFTPQLPVIVVKAVKQGCYVKTVASFLDVDLPLINTHIPTMQQDRTVRICYGTTESLSASVVDETLVWNTGEIGETAHIDAGGVYFAYSIDANGCKSENSDTVIAEQLPNYTSVDAGRSISVCKSYDTVFLAPTPLGGVWESPLVAQNSEVYLNQVPAGEHYLTYNFCGIKDSLKLEVKGKPNVSKQFYLGTNDTVCYNEYDVRITFYDEDDAFQSSLRRARLYVDDSLTYTYTSTSGRHNEDGYWFSFNEDLEAGTHPLMFEYLLDNGCAIDSVQFYDTLEVVEVESPGEVRLENDTICSGTTGVIYIENPNESLDYYLLVDEYDWERYEDTVHFEIIDDSLFYVGEHAYYEDLFFEAQNYLGCKTNKIFVPKPVKESLFRKTEVSSYGTYIGDSISIIDRSTLRYSVGNGNYTNGILTDWVLDQALKVESMSNLCCTFSAEHEGEFNVSMIAKSPHGCVDTVSHTISFYEAYTNKLFESICSMETIKDSLGRTLSPNFDLLEFRSTGELIGVSHTSNYRGVKNYISQISTNGVLTNLFSAQPGGCSSLFIDRSDNILLGGSLFDDSRFTMYETVNKPDTDVRRSKYEFNYGFVSKINNENKPEWINISFDDVNETAVTSIRQLSDENYQIATEQDVISWGMTNSVKLNIGNVITLDSSGQYVKSSYMESDFEYGYDCQKGLSGNDCYRTLYTPTIFSTINGDFFVRNYIDKSLTYDSAGTSWYQNLILVSPVADAEQIVSIHLKDRFSRMNSYRYSTPYNHHYMHAKTGALYVSFDNSIHKYSANGDFLWEAKFEGINTNIETFLLYEDDVYVVGTFQDFMNLSGTNQPNAVVTDQGLNTIYIAKLNSGGEVTGCSRLRSEGVDKLLNVAFSPDNELVILLHASKDVYLDEALIQKGLHLSYMVRFPLDECVSKTNEDKYVYEPDVEWLRTVSSTDKIKGLNVAVDENNDVYFLGDFTGTMTIGKESYTMDTYRNESDEFFVKYSSTGDLQWSHHLSGQDDYSYGSHYDSEVVRFVYENNALHINSTSIYAFIDTIEINNRDRIRIAVGKDGVVDTVSNEHYTLAEDTVYLNKLSRVLEEANLLSYVHYSSTTFDANDNLYLIVREANHYSLYKYSTSGDLLWRYTLPLDKTGYSFDLAVGSQGNIYVCGTSAEVYLAENGTEMSYADQAFLMKIKDDSFSCDTVSDIYKPIVSRPKEILCHDEWYPITVNEIGNYHVLSKYAEIKQGLERFWVLNDSSENYEIRLQDPNNGCYAYYDSIYLNVAPILTPTVEREFYLEDPDPTIQYNAYMVDLTYGDENLVSFTWTPDSIFDYNTLQTVSLKTSEYYNVQVHAQDVYGCSYSDVYNSFQKVHENEDYVKPGEKPVSIADESIEISAFPIPTTDVLRVRVPDGTLTLELVSPLGQVVLRETLNGETKKDLNVAHYSSGVYQLRATLTDSTLTYNVMVVSE